LGAGVLEGGIIVFSFFQLSFKMRGGVSWGGVNGNGERNQHRLDALPPPPPRGYSSGTVLRVRVDMSRCAMVSRAHQRVFLVVKANVSIFFGEKVRRSH
jgi:hypothetical protein